VLLCIVVFRVFHISKLLFCFAIFVTYMLCFYVPMDFLEPTLLRWLNIDKTKKIKKLTFHIVFRSTIVIITGECSVVVKLVKQPYSSKFHMHTI